MEVRSVGTAQDIQHLPVRINGPPHRVLFTSDGLEDLIEMPRITGLCSPSAQLVCVVVSRPIYFWLNGTLGALWGKAYRRNWEKGS